MNPSKIVSRRAAILLAVVFAFGCVASADTVYNVSGTFGQLCVDLFGCATPGVLNGGTFSGTFSANLPFPANDPETISTFNISLINSSGTVLYTLSNAAGGRASVTGQGDCEIGDATVPCDAFTFEDQGSDAIFGLLTPAGFTGGLVYPLPGTVYPYLSTAQILATPAPFNAANAVTSGTIDPVTPTPEPGTLLLFGTALLLVMGLLSTRRERTMQAAAAPEIVRPSLLHLRS